jgi:hypothetical protein
VHKIVSASQNEVNMSVSALSSLFSRRDWENPVITHWHRLPAHAPMSSWRDVGEALHGEVPTTRRLLNGDWQFNFFIARVRTGKLDHGRSRRCGAMPVPSNWQMQGFDTPFTPTSPIPSRLIRRLYRRKIRPVVTRSHLMSMNSG